MKVISRRSVLLACASLVSCKQLVKLTGYRDPRELGNSRPQAVAAAEELLLGLVWPVIDERSAFYNGALLAQEEINSSGGVLGKRIQFLLKQSLSADSPAREVSERGRTIALELAQNPEVFAIIGHETSTAAIPASVVYDQYGLLYISPSATTPLLTHLGFNSLFRTIQDDEKVGGSLARFAHSKGWKRIALINSRSMYGEGLARAFYEETSGDELKVNVVFRQSFFPKEDHFAPMIAQLKKADVDAILLAADGISAARIVQQARKMDLDVPIFAGDGLYGKDFLENAKGTAEGIYIATSIEPGGWSESTHDFAIRYRKRFHSEPDGWSVQSYDAVKLLAHAVQHSQTFDTTVVTSMIRFHKAWQGVVSEYAFDWQGNILHRDIYMKQIKNDKVVDVGTFTWDTERTRQTFHLKTSE